METLLRGLSLHTVCQQAKCPNIGECFCRGYATFLILGAVCTRRCGFCAVSSGTPAPLDDTEPERVAEAASRLSLRHIVVTSVTRDDLPDGGAGMFARTIVALRGRLPASTIEVLIPDFRCNDAAIATVVAAHPDIIGHNVETVLRLYPTVRPGADFYDSLSVLDIIKKKDPSMKTKSGLMLGLGETEREVLETFFALRNVDCDFLSIGQYLSPSGAHVPVSEYVPPERFVQYKREAELRGFAHVESGPYVRSSYQAEHYRVAEPRQ